MSDRVLIEIEGAVAHVRLNRPDKRNGLDMAMFEAIIAAGEQLIADKSVRAVVLSGNGSSFCAGLDFAAMLEVPDAIDRLLDRPAGRVANAAQRVAWIWSELPVPVIAALHGHAIGGGLQIALAADIRLCHPDAKLCVMEMKYGMIPDMSISRTLLRLVRLDVAKELTWTHRAVSGAEAVQLGLVTRLSDDPVADALALAAEIASRSPHAVRAAKAMYERAADLDLAGRFELETELQRGLLGTPNQQQALVAALTRQTPEFVDPD